MIRCEKLTKYYGKTHALNAMDLHIGAGELHGFVGPNGAGKTTAMRILATLMKPTSGDALIDGVSVSEQPQQARKLVGYMPDFFGVYDDLKAWEYLDFYAGCMSVGAKERRKRIDELLDLTVLSDKREAYVDNLSRGMKQRLCLARALLHNPKLLILDEPASGMDPRSRAQMRDILTEVQRMGKTVLISSHILPELAQMCSHVTILEGGRPFFSGRVEAFERTMRLSHALRIRFAAELDESLRKALDALALEIFGVQPEGEGGNTLLIRAEDDVQKDEAMLRGLMQLGAPVCDYHRERATLEKVFMEVTRHDDESNL